MARDLKLFSFVRGSGLLHTVSDEFVELIGLPAQHLIDRPVSDIVTPFAPTGTDQSMSWLDPEPVLAECRLHPADDEALTLRLIVRPDPVDGLWQAAAVDIGGILALVLQRRELRARLSLIAEDAHTTMWRYDYLRDHLVWERHASDVLATAERDLPTDLATLLSWVPEGQRTKVEETVEQISEIGSGRCEISVSDRLQNRHLVLRGRVWDLATDGSSRRAVGVLEDVTAARELERQSLTMAVADPLTGLGNRRAFDRALREEMRRARSTGSSVSVLLLFVDRFGKFAAQVGSAIADQAVVTIARTLAGAVNHDLIYRFDGASFAVIVQGGDSVGVQELMHAMLERTAAVELRQALGYSFAVTAGCASSDGEADLKSPELLRRAERALQRAQEAGGAVGYAYESSVAGLEELREAVTFGLRNDEFELVYQPQIRLSDERLVGLEAHVRWNRGPGEVLEPAEFMTAIDSSDIARELGRWVLGAAADQIAAWDRDDRLRNVWVDVDLTPQYAAHPRLSDDVAQALADSGIDPFRLQLGVMGTAIRSPNGDFDRLADITQLGVRAAVDDLQSLPFQALGTLPVDVVKIDQRFLSHTEPPQRRLGELTIEAAHLHGLTVLVTGISSAGVQHRLAQLGCDLGQGDHIAEAMSAEAVLRYAGAVPASSISAPPA
jgi:diguanylate cyclase (GGDEF)-like protein